MKITARLIPVFLLQLLAASTCLAAPASKMDPALAIVLKKGVASAAQSKALKSLPAGAGPYVETLVRFQGDLSGVEALGGHIRSTIGNIASVDIPVSALSQISALPNIVYIESSKRLKRRLDLSVPATGANLLRSGTPPNWTGATGRGVVIGVVDSGVDLSHMDLRDTCGGTRVRYLWDQATAGTRPSGFTYGNECTKAMIDSNQCSETDTDGHGTHVTSIAAGNGSAGSTPYKYVGMAPQADIVAVNSLNSGVTLTTATVVDAMSYIQQKAAALGEPSVINLSFGGHVDPHDGTSAFEQAIDNASVAGSVVVCAAGNEAQADIHASGGNITPGGSTTVSFSVPSTGTDAQNLDMWYAGADQLEIWVNFGSTCAVGPVPPGQTMSQRTVCGVITVSNAPSGPDPVNGDNEIYVTLDNNGGATPIAPGTWTFILKNLGFTTSGRFDAWIDDTVTSNAVFTSNIDTSITLDDCGTATDSFSVGAYTTKTSWTSINGGTYTLASPDPLGAIGSFSSLGPRRTCTNTANCPAVQKPDLAAPGEVIMGAYSSQTCPAADPSLIDPDGVHVIEYGTSMSAPHVSGAVALILEKSPTLTYSQVKSYILSNVKTDGFTGAVPNNTWGYGKLDARTAFNAVPGSLPSTPPASCSGSISITSTKSCSSGGGASASGSGGGCFIATAAYGSYLDPHVMVLREFRDRYLMTNAPGRAFVALYYRISPQAAVFIRGHETLRVLTRFALTPIVYSVEYPGAALAVVCLGVIVFIPLRSRIKKRRP